MFLGLWFHILCACKKELSAVARQPVYVTKVYINAYIHVTLFFVSKHLSNRHHLSTGNKMHMNKIDQEPFQRLLQVVVKETVVLIKDTSGSKSQTVD